MASFDHELEHGGDDPAEPEGLAEYWTDDRRRSAFPLLPEFDQGKGHISELPEPSGVTEVIREPKPINGGGNSGYAKQPRAPGNHGINSSKVTDKSVNPYRCVGKVFMTFDGIDYVGSGWAAAPSAVLTAGHCLYSHDSKGWARNLIFAPAYENHQMPYGFWSLADKVVFKEWSRNRNFALDIGAFKTAAPIEPSVGSLGWRAHGGIISPFTACGYPAASPYDGQSMWQSTSGLYLWDDHQWYMNCRFTGGASGGPWVVWKENVPYAYGLTSHTRSDYKGKLFSPMFLDCIVKLDGWMN